MEAVLTLPSSVGNENQVLSIDSVVNNNATLQWVAQSGGGGCGGDITGIAAGSGLTGGGNDGNVTLNVGTGSGITVNADSMLLILLKQQLHH